MTGVERLGTASMWFISLYMLSSVDVEHHTCFLPMLTSTRLSSDAATKMPKQVNTIVMGLRNPARNG